MEYKIGERRKPAPSTVVLLVAALLVCVANHSNAAFNSLESESDRGARQLTVDIINSTSITLKWSTPGRSSVSSCQPQRYMIRLKQAGIRQSRAWKLEGERHTVSLHDLQPGTEYQVRLMTITCDGQKKHSRWVKVTTLAEESAAQQEETHAPGQPTSVRTRTYVDSAVVSWSSPEDNTLVRTYMIGYGEGVPDVKWIYVNGSQRNVTILNLKPSTQYVISVRAINNYGKGLVVYDLVYTREASQSRLSAGASLPAPVQLTSRIVTPSSVHLQWTDPSLDSQQRITDERYYNVYYQAAPSGKNLSVIVKALHVTLPDLLPNRQYRFKVRTVKGAHTSPFSDSITNWTRLDSTSIGDMVTSPSAGKMPTPQPAPTQRGYASSVVIDDYEDYPDPAEADDGHIDVMQQSTREQGKTKRAHHSRPPLGSPPQPAMARTLIDLLPPPVNRTTSTSSSSSNVSSASSAATASAASATMLIQFRTLVQHRISAYVTWPDKPALTCSEASLNGTVTGYAFRYKVLEVGAKTASSANEFVVRNLVGNFVLLDNLMPKARYSYQVRYVFDRGEPSAWSQEALLDTEHSPPART